MKKLLLALAIGTASLVGLSSCTKEYNTYEIQPGISFYEPLSSDDWTRNSENTKVYSAEISVPELDDAYYEDGTVDVSIQFEDAKGEFHNIPAEYLRNHSYKASYAVGKVYIDSEYVGSGNATPPPAMRVKIAITLTEIGN